jgi:hypothetical protein
MFVKRLIYLIPCLLLSAQEHSYHDKGFYYFKKSIPKTVETYPLYRIKIGAYTYHDNAKKAANSSLYPSYILKGKKFYYLYIGTYHDRTKAIEALIQLQKHYHDAYMITTYHPIKKKSIYHEKDFFKEAKAYFNKGDYESALALFDKEMILHPENHLAALEYARTLYILGFYKQSKRAFLEVLSRNPPPNVKKNIYTFLEKIEEKITTTDFYGTIMIGSSYDDNLGYNSSDKTFQYGELLLENDTNKTAGFYTNLNLLLTYYYKKENFTWENKLYSYNEFQQEEEIEDLNFLQFTSTFSQNFQNLTITLPLGISQTWFGKKRDNLSLFTWPTLSYLVTPNNSISLMGKYHSTKHQQDSAKSYHRIGGALFFTHTYLQGDIRTSIGHEEDTKEEGLRQDISKERDYIGVTLNYALRQSSLLSLHYRHTESNYQDIDPVLAYAREDKRDQITLGIQENLTKSHSLSFIYTYLNNESNINSYSYEKNIFSLNYNYSF